ncbi:AAA ATPase, central region (plasmid) [Leptolyngbya sp. NIES-3755]|nr:AAA ATPase, central region [Leptolyngbya sp. NIES-3755]
MKGELLKRLFRAIASEDKEAIQSLLTIVVEEERKKGHSTLADQLSNITKRSNSNHSSIPLPPGLPAPPPGLPKSAFPKGISSRPTLTNAVGILSELPSSKRSNHPFVISIPRDRLKHHMILPHEIEDRFRRVEREYAARERLAHYGLSYRQKILLYGSPGCGKTMGAERLAWNTGLPLLKVRFDALVSSYLGETASNLRAVFELAAQNPCLLLIDECDAIAKSREDSQEVGEIKRVVNAFLQMLDEFESVNGLLVAATNLDKSLDQAIWRRFDDVIEVPKPTVREIEAILKQTFSSVTIGTINWETIVQKMQGFSAAETVRVAQDAAKRAVLDREELVIQDHLEASIQELRAAHV